MAESYRETFKQSHTHRNIHILHPRSGFKREVVTIHNWTKKREEEMPNTTKYVTTTAENEKQL